MTHFARKTIRDGFAHRVRNRRGPQRDGDADAPLHHIEETLLSLVMRSNFDEQAAMLFNQQIAQMTVAGDSLGNPLLREQFRLKALQALGRLKPKAAEKRAHKAPKPRPLLLKMELPFI